MIRFSKVKLNGFYYLSVTQDTLNDFNKYGDRTLLHKHKCKTLGIKVLSKEIEKVIDYMYIEKDMQGQYYLIYIGMLNKIRYIFKDITIDDNKVETYSKNRMSIPNYKRCGSCNGLINSNGSCNVNNTDLCCHNKEFIDVYRITHSNMQVCKYENKTITTSNYEELELFKKSMLDNKLKSYGEAYKNLGKVVFTVSKNEILKNAKIKIVIDKINDYKEIGQIVIDSRIKNEQAIKMILEHKISSPIEQILLDKLVSKEHIEVLPQYVIDNYRVDFLIKYNGISLVVECDGEQYHTIEYDYPRHRKIQILGYNIIRFSGSEIVKNPNLCAREIMEYIETILRK